MNLNRSKKSNTKPDVKESPRKEKKEKEPSLVLSDDDVGSVKKTTSKRRLAGQAREHTDGVETHVDHVPTPQELGAPKPVEANGDDIPKIAEMSWASLAWEVAGSLGSALSGDLFSSGISLPCNMYEPLSILQRSIEFLEFTSCLDAACKQKMSSTRLAYVVGFALSPLPIAENRWKLDFNPILGETFEYIDTRAASPVKCFTEQVSHHPPIAAVHAENENFKFYQNYGAVTNFLGNSVEVNTNSKSYVYLKATKEEYIISSPKIRVHNLIMGTMWLEYFGELIVDNLTTGDTCLLKFSKSGWLAGGPDYEVNGYCKNKQGQKKIKLKGMWNTNLQALWLEDHGEDGPKGKQFCPWRRKKLDFTGKQFPLTPFAWSFNTFPDEMKKVVLPSDSRRRPDRAALNLGDADTATAWKRVAEGQQRVEQKARRGENKEDPWRPVWFTREKDHEGKPFYKFTDKYWETRDEAEKKGEPFIHDQVKNTAADFMHYKENYATQFEQASKAKKGVVCPEKDK